MLFVPLLILYTKPFGDGAMDDGGRLRIELADSSDDVKDRFYDTLYSTLRRISQDDKIILLGDFNARVGRNHDIWHGVIGHHGVGNMNSSGLRLLSLCSQLGLAITNTFFQLRDMLKTSWMHPRSKHWHLIDYIIVRRRDLNEVQITRAMHGAECSTDHRLIRSTLRLTVRPPARRQKPRHKLNVHAAHNQNIREKLRNAIDQSLSHISMTTTLNCTSNLTMEWQALSSALLTASQSTLGNMERRHQDWFDDNATDIRSLIQDKMLHTMLSCIIQLLALFVNVFPLSVRQCSAS